MVDYTIYEPLKLYNTELKNKVVDETKKLFSELVKKSGTDRNLNRETFNKYSFAKSKAEATSKDLKRFKNLRLMFWLLAAGAVIGGGYACSLSDKTLKILLPLILFPLAILFVYLAAKKYSEKISALEERYNKDSAEVEKLYDQCREQTENLCAMLDWNMAAKVVRRTSPIIQLDDRFDYKKFDILQNKYGFLNSDPQKSVEAILSGSLIGNPFLLTRYLCQEMRMKTYTGSLNISWVVVTYDSEGRRRTETRYQTLYASIQKPCPFYYRDTFIVYGNDSAPNLNFTREPTGFLLPDVKTVSKFVKKAEREISRKADKAVREHSNYTPFANLEFEALWGGTDRNNEIEYRLLFTPLAQVNEMDLIKKDNNYGDDFYFQKSGRLNYVTAKHIQDFDIKQNPMKFYNISVDVMENQLTDYICEFYRQIYFNLAPLLAIPLYQQIKPVEYIYQDSYASNFPIYESESMANSLPSEYFSPNNSVTENILKVEGILKCGKTDKVKIKAHAFRSEDRVTLVPTMGGDGHMHNVPVHWKEYFPVEKDAVIGVKGVPLTRYEYNQKETNVINTLKRNKQANTIHFERGLLAFLASEILDEETDIELDTVFGYNNKKEED